MNSFYQKTPYPVSALPNGVNNFIRRVCTATQASDELVAPVVLSAMSAAVQGVVDVKSANGLVMPSSLFFGVIAPSGGRKSSVLRYVTSAFEAFEQGHLGSEEAHPFLLEEATEQGLIDLFLKNAKSVFFALSEGSQMLRRLDHAMFCKLFDGATLRHTSRKNDTVIVPNTRSSVCMLIQNEVFRRYLQKKQEAMMESGFLPRMLMSFPADVPTSYVFQQEQQWNEDLQSHPFHERIRELLKDYSNALQHGNQNRKLLLLNQNAQYAWQSFYQNTENWLMQSSCDGSWEGVEAFVRRAGEQVLRLAAVLQHFDRPQPSIEQHYVDAAIQVVSWHLWEARLAFVVPPLSIQVSQWADALYSYLWRHYQAAGTSQFMRSDLLRCAPTLIRKADRLQAAMNYLVRSGNIRIAKEGRKEYVELNIFHTLSPYTHNPMAKAYSQANLFV